MNVKGPRAFAKPLAFKSCLAVNLLLSSVAGISNALADDDGFRFTPGNLLVSRSVYDNNPKNVEAGVTLLPPNCVASACVTATDSGSYPNVWNNVIVDGNFGIAAKIVLDQLRPTGSWSIRLKCRTVWNARSFRRRDQMVTSFPSKSEIALNLSTDGHVRDVHGLPGAS